jgi:ABC-type thiamine transport system ATPase subunit
MVMRKDHLVRIRVAKLKEKVRRLLAGVEKEEGFVAPAPAMPVREVFRRFWPFARPYRRFIPLLLVFAVLGPAIEGAKFGYPGTRKEMLSDISIGVAPDAGQVRLDGYDLKGLSLRSLLENVAVLLQETLVFDGTIRENIGYGRPDATEEEILRTARAADAHEFIERLPEGYDTVIGQKGRLLSGAQRQRVAVARTMVRDAPVLIIDEPTTGLDAASGEKVMAPLRRQMSVPRS